MNSQHENTILSGDFVLKNRFETFVLKNISDIQNKSDSGRKNSINNHLRLKIPTHTTRF